MNRSGLFAAPLPDLLIHPDKSRRQGETLKQTPAQGTGVHG
jgi:hypothetical protein